MRRYEPLVPPREGSRILDGRDLGRVHRSWLATTAIFGALVTLGILACAALVDIGTEQRLVARTVRFDGSWRPGWRPVTVLDTESHLPELTRVVAGLALASPAAGYLIFLLGLSDRVRRARWRKLDRRLAAEVAALSLGELREGQPVRVRGRVVGEAGFTSAGGLPRTVLASYLGSTGSVWYRPGRARLCWELHAADFMLALDEGAHVRVRVAGGTLLRPPLRPAPGLLESRPLACRSLSEDSAAAVYHEQVVTPGDQVVVSGELSTEVDPTAEAGPRGVRLRGAIVSDAACRLTIGPIGWWQDDQPPWSGRPPPAAT
jgi:hypothetical protein